MRIGKRFYGYFVIICKVLQKNNTYGYSFQPKGSMSNTGASRLLIS